MMPGNGNGSFIRAIFWALLIGSFGWATFIGITTMSAMSGHCTEAEAKMAAIKTEMVARDEKNLEIVIAGLRIIEKEIIEQKTDIKWIKEKIK